MDPDANLEEQLWLAKQLQTAIDKDDAISRIAVGRLVDLVESLDGWLRLKNALPRDWER